MTSPPLPPQQATGISPYKDGRGGSRHDLFYEKLGIVKTEANYVMRRGTATEPLALRDYCRQTGATVRGGEGRGGRALGP